MRLENRRVKLEYIIFYFWKRAQDRLPSLLQKKLYKAQDKLALLMNSREKLIETDAQLDVLGSCDNDTERKLSNNI
jgi:exonuclease VII small subunit